VAAKREAPVCAHARRVLWTARAMIPTAHGCSFERWRKRRALRPLAAVV